ncbi:SCP-like protein [Teladorsagia circumcincta]|uniref:SCP-like protein n=1 Tax=Teladorsagia circumcincta TaxID=45464 RepID=A0A2G9T4T6_TELCI|nr:SCP-like protein [Teladorsagia circumcincta]
MDFKHNLFRSLAAKGLTKFGGYAPKAARIRKMVYDCNVEANAVRHAVKCRWGHSNKLERLGLGENVWATAVPEMNRSVAADMVRAPVNINDFSLEITALQCCESLFIELERYVVGEDNVLTNELFYRQNEQFGYYTQMVWQDSCKLACVVKYCDPSPAPMTFVVCHGNFIDQFIYGKGEPCQTDDVCRCAICKCSRDEALCIMP